MNVKILKRKLTEVNVYIRDIFLQEDDRKVIFDEVYSIGAHD
jgi:hypothetical protein